MKSRIIWGAAAVAIAITLIIRFTVFNEDCNLFIVGITFLACFGATYVAGMILRRWSKRRS